MDNRRIFIVLSAILASAFFVLAFLFSSTSVVEAQDAVETPTPTAETTPAPPTEAPKPDEVEEIEPEPEAPRGTPEPTMKMDWVMPILGSSFAPGYGYYEDYAQYGGEPHHTGWDLPAPVGSVVKAAGNGEVVLVQRNWNTFVGWDIAIYHGVDPNTQLGHWTFYMHLSSAQAQVGETVTAGQQIGLSGSAGTGGHLHYAASNQPPESFSGYYEHASEQADGRGWINPSIQPPELINKQPDGSPEAAFAFLMEEAYRPRPANANDPAHDESQPLAPMWKEQSPTIWWWRGNIYRWAEQFHLNPNVIATVMQIESCGDANGGPNGESVSGAQGLFQVMPLHWPAAEQTKVIMQDPEANAEKGLGYMAGNLSQTSDIYHAFAAYNMGPRGLSWAFSAMPQETQSYVHYTQMLEDAFAGAEHSDVLQEWLNRDGGWLCNSAAAYQGVHQPVNYTPGGIVEHGDNRPAFQTNSETILIDLPPFGWLLLFLSLATLLKWGFGSVKWSKRVVKLVIWLIVIFWFPLNFWHLPKATKVGAYAYTNVAYELREWFEVKGRLVDDAATVSKVLESVELPGQTDEIVQRLVEPVAKLKGFKDDVITVMTWLGDDPILTPAFQFVSDVFQHYIVRDKGIPPEAQLATSYDFAPVVAEGDPVFLRRVVGNPWGLHGNANYRALELKSWIGTDVLVPPDSFLSSPIDGVVEDITIGGGHLDDAVGIWISNETVRFGVIGINTEDPSFVPGQVITATTPIGRPVGEGETLHVIVQVRNQDGTWGDYPFALLLAAKNVPFGYFDVDPPQEDPFVPRTAEIVDGSDLLSKEVADIEN